MKQIQIGMFGVGVVGSHVIALLREHRELIECKLGATLLIKRAVVAHPDKPREISLAGIEVSADPQTIFDDPEIEIVLELIGGVDTAAHVLLQALQQKCPVVTANKALLAERAFEIVHALGTSGVPMGIEAAVGGSIPVLRALREGLAANQILDIAGIINGTANYILTAMSRSQTSFETALSEAQRLGYAEADPSFDIHGQDTAHKLAILVNLAYGGIVEYPSIYCEGISKITPMDIQYAAQLGYVIKLLAIARPRDKQIEARVHPALVAVDHPLAGVNGANNAVYVVGDHAGPYLCQGQGAGGRPTASAVVSDIMEIACWLIDGAPTHSTTLGLTAKNADHPLSVMPIEDSHGEYYLRFQVLDKVGVLAVIAKIMGQHQISIQSVLQPSQAETPQQPVQIILTTHRAREEDVRQSVEEICKQPFIAGTPQLLRMAGV